MAFPWSVAEQYDWVNNRYAGDLSRHLAHYDVAVMGYHEKVSELWFLSHHDSGASAHCVGVISRMIGWRRVSGCVECYSSAKRFTSMNHMGPFYLDAWWRHQMETISALLAFCVGNSPVTGEFPSQRPVARRFDVFFDLRLNQQLSKQWRRRWFETPSRSL